MIEQQNTVRDDKRAEEKAMWDAAEKHLDTFGTQNKEALSFFENQLSIPSGSLSSFKTIEELKMKKSGGEGGFASIVDTQRQQIQAAYPNASGEMVDQLVYATLSKQMNTANLGKAYNYMASSPVKGESYRIQPFLTASSGEKIVNSTIQMLEDQRAVELGDMTPAQLVQSLQAEEDAKGNKIFSNDDIIKYMKGIGYTHAPAFFSRFKSEFAK